MSVIYSTSHTSDSFFKEHEQLLSSYDQVSQYSIENVIYISFLESELERKNFELVLMDLERYFLKKTVSDLKYKLDIKDINSDYFTFDIENI